MIFLFFLLFFFAALISFYLLRALLRFYRSKSKGNKEDVSKVGFVVDTFHELVSKLKEKERELEILRQSAEDRAVIIEGYNENILQSVPSGVMSFDEEMRIAKINLAAERILEVRRDMILGRHHTDVLNEPMTNLINERKIIERGEIWYKTPSGKKIWLGLTLSPLKNQEGKTIGQILVFTDLTQLKALQSQMELRARLSSLGEISAGIAHELRNPMGVITGYTKLLSRKIDEPLKPTVDAIVREIDVMNRIISDFLSFAKPDELTITDVDLKMIFDNCVKTLTGSRKDIKTSIDISGIPAVKGDEVLLRQAFTNLIQNAVEAMPSGGELTIRSSTGDFLEIAVSDTGSGIAEGIADKIFLPFFTTKDSGTGLGLAIAQKIIISHGGSISVAPGTDKGTTFKVRLHLK